MREEKIAHDNMISKLLVGSHSYNLNTPESDRDYEGVFIEPPEYVIGRSRVDEVNLGTNKTNEKNSKDDVDFKLYTLRTFFDLAILNNPNKIEHFYAQPSCVIYHNKYWDLIVENKHLFLSQKCKHSFSGYAISQRKKLLTKKTRLEELRKFVIPLKAGLDRGLRTVGEALSQSDFDGQFVITDKKNNDIYVTVDEKNYNFGFDLRKIHDQIQAQIDRYGSRTADLREHGFDLKFASHIFRLAYLGIELLETGKLTLPLQGEQLAIIRRVRAGGYSLDEVLDLTAGFDEMFEQACKKTSLPKTPDLDRIHELQMMIHTNYWKEKGWY